MNTLMDPLTEALKPYLTKRVFVRLFSPPIWYAGKLEGTEVSPEGLAVELAPVMRFGRKSQTDPHEIGKSLVTVDDYPIANSKKETGEIFKIRHAAISKTPVPEGVLIIESEDRTQVLILSVRFEDVFAIESLLNCRPHS